MKCVICKIGTTQPGVATVTLDRDGSTVIFQNVPAEICKNCGEQYVSSEETKRIMELAEREANSGVKVEIRAYQ